MNPEAVARRVEAIANLVDDPEVAHAREDELWRDVLQAIADGKAWDARLCARRALQTAEISFPRWCA